MVVLFLIFHAAGGWYFAGELRADGFAVKPHEPEYRSKIVSLESDLITLDQGDPADGELFTPGVYGLTWEGGYGEVSTIVDQTQSQVTRQFVHRGGDQPSVGLAVDVDPWLYPQFQLSDGTEVSLVEYESPLGTMEAVFAPGTTETWAVLVHGKNAAPAETARLGGILNEAGLPLLAITHRNDLNQPSDPSGFHRFGVTEWEDLQGAVDYAVAQGADEIVLAGLSTGAAVVFSFLENSDRADRVSAVIVDSPNIDFGSTVDHSAAARRLPLVGLPIPGTLVWVAKSLATVHVGVDWEEIDYLARTDHLQVPVLAIHGTADPSVPVDISRRLAAQRPDLVTLVEFEGAKHVQSWNANPGLYRETVLQFLMGL